MVEVHDELRRVGRAGGAQDRERLAGHAGWRSLPEEVNLDCPCREVMKLLSKADLGPESAGDSANNQRGGTILFPFL